LARTGEGVSQIGLTWTDNANDEDGYRIERKTGNGEFIELANIPAGSTSFMDGEVEELGTYIYHVYAYNANGVSAFSNPLQVDLPFVSPTNLVAQAVSSNEVSLNWNDNSAVETGYRIERRSGSGAYITIVNVGNSVSSFTDLTVNPLTNYTYRIIGISFNQLQSAF
jgi:transcriptional regulator CtsR